MISFFDFYENDIFKFSSDINNDSEIGGGGFNDSYFFNWNEGDQNIDETKLIFNPPIHSQTEENIASLFDEESQDQGLYQSFNLSTIRNDETPFQPSIESNNSTPISNEGSSNQSSIDSNNIRIDDLHMEIFCDPLVYFKSLLKKRFGLNIYSFNCGEILKKNTEEKKKILKNKIIELLNHDYQISKRIKEKLKSIDNNVKKRELNYFLNITYEKLFWHYINNNKDFHISIGASTKIKEFITLEEAIQLKIKKLGKRGKYKNNKAFLQYKYDLYKKRAKKIIEKIKLGQMERGKTTIKIFKISKDIKRKKNDA